MNIHRCAWFLPDLDKERMCSSLLPLLALTWSNISLRLRTAFGIHFDY